MALDLKRREYLSDLCYNSLKKCLVCAENMKDCRPNCLEHAEILSNLIRGLMRNSPHIAQEMQLAIHACKTCSGQCAKHDNEHCRACSDACEKLGNLLSTELKNVWGISLPSSP